MLILEKALNIPGWFILPGGAGISAQEADRVKEPGTFLWHGSETPFWLICNEFTIENDVLFERIKLPIRKGRFHCDIPSPLAGLPVFWFDAVDVFQTCPGEIIDVR